MHYEIYYPRLPLHGHRLGLIHCDFVTVHLDCVDQRMPEKNKKVKYEIEDK